MLNNDDFSLFQPFLMSIFRKSAETVSQVGIVNGDENAKQFHGWCQCRVYAAVSVKFQFQNPYILGFCPFSKKRRKLRDWVGPGENS